MRNWCKQRDEKNTVSLKIAIQVNYCFDKQIYLHKDQALFSLRARTQANA